MEKGCVADISYACHWAVNMDYSSGNGCMWGHSYSVFFFQAEVGIRAATVTGVQTCALPIFRPEATGYGCVYSASEMLKARGQSLAGKICLVSGSGNVSQYTVEKLIDMGAKPVTLSDSNGMIYDPAGIDREKLAWVMDLKNVRRGRMKEYADKFKGAKYVPDDPQLDYNPI